MNSSRLTRVLVLPALVLALAVSVLLPPAGGQEEETTADRALREAVEKGKVLFNEQRLGTAEKVCATCHARPDRPKMHLGPRVGDYPKYERRLKRVVTLGQKIQLMIVKMLKGEERELGSEELVAIEAYLMSLSRAR